MGPRVPRSSRRRLVALRGRWVAVASVAFLVVFGVAVGQHESRAADAGKPDPQSCAHHLVTDDSSKAGGALTVDMILRYHPSAGASVHLNPRLTTPSGFPLSAVVKCQVATLPVEQLWGVPDSTQRLVATVRGGDIQASSDTRTGLLSVHRANRVAEVGSGAEDSITFAGWYVTFVDPQPGAYHFSQDVIWSSPEWARYGSGLVDVTITVHKAAPR